MQRMRKMEEKRDELSRLIRLRCSQKYVQKILDRLQKKKIPPLQTFLLSGYGNHHVLRKKRAFGLEMLSLSGHKEK